MPSINRKRKGTTGQNEKYRRILHAIVKIGEEKTPFIFGQQEENTAILL